MEHSANIKMMKVNHETLLILESFAGSCGTFVVGAVEVVIDMIIFHWLGAWCLQHKTMKKGKGDTDSRQILSR
jgi:uncharacterized membrane protein YsdA (DUF1294 family)